MYMLNKLNQYNNSGQNKYKIEYIAKESPLFSDTAVTIVWWYFISYNNKITTNQHKLTL